MSPARIVRTAGIALILFGLLLMPRLRLGRAYSAAFRAQASLLLGFDTDLHAIEFRPQPEPGNENDVVVVIGARGVPRDLTVGFRSHFGFLPTALFLALAAATWVPWSRWLRLLLCGLAWVDLYVLTGTALTVLRAWSVHARNCAFPHASFLSGSTWWKLLERCDSILTRAPSLNLLVALLVWLALAGREWWWPTASPRAEPGQRTAP